MAKKVKLGTQIVSLSEEAFSGLRQPGQPAQPTAVSPYQGSLQGQGPDQAKMMGTPAATRKLTAPPPTDTLRAAIRSSQTPTGGAGTQRTGFNFDKAARVDEALAGVFAQQMTLAKVAELGIDEDKAKAVGLNPDQLKLLTPVVNKLLGGETLLASEENALKSAFGNQTEDQLKEMAANLIKEPDDALVLSLKDQIKNGTANFRFGDVPPEKLNKILVDEGLAERKEDGSVDYSYIEDVMGPNWRNMSYQDWSAEVTKRRESFTDVKQLQLLLTDPQLSPAAANEIRQQLVQLGYSGVLAEMSAAERLEVEARNGYSLNVGGKQVAIDELLDGLVLENEVSSALAAGPGSDAWNSLAPELKEWLDKNYYTVKDTFEKRTGLIATGLGEGIQRARTREEEEAKRKAFDASLQKSGFNPQLFRDHFTAESLASVLPYANIPNGIVSALKSATDPDYIKNATQSINALLQFGDASLIDGILKQPRSFSKGERNSAGKFVLKTFETAAGKMFQQLLQTKPEQRAALMSRWQRTAKDFNALRTGSPEIFARTVLGVSNPTSTLAELNRKYTTGNYTDAERKTFQSLDYNKDGKIDMQDMAAQQSALKSGEEAIPSPERELARFGFAQDTDIAGLKKSIASVSSILGKTFDTAQKREETAKKTEAANTNFATRLDGYKGKFEEFGIKVPSNLQNEYVSAYINKGVDAAETILSNYIRSLDLPGKEARRKEEADKKLILKQQQAAKEEANTKTYSTWYDKYSNTATRKLQAQVRDTIFPSNAYTTPYQNTLYNAYVLLRLRLQMDKSLPPNFNYAEMDRAFLTAATSGKSKTGRSAEDILAQLKKGVDTHQLYKGTWVKDKKGNWEYRVRSARLSYVKRWDIQF